LDGNYVIINTKATVIHGTDHLDLWTNKANFLWGIKYCCLLYIFTHVVLFTRGQQCRTSMHDMWESCLYDFPSGYPLYSLTQTWRGSM